MESLNEDWDLPEGRLEREERVSEISDELIARFDKMYFEIMNKFLAELREEDRQRSLDKDT